MDQSAAIQFYESVYQAMFAGDVARLEGFTHLSSFPCGTDGWLKSYWLSTAIETGNPDAVVWVLSKGASATYMDDCGSTALIETLEIEGSYNQSIWREEPLPDDAVAALIIRIINLLIEAGIDINQRVGLDNTALHRAASWSSPDVVRHLLSLGADPMAADRDYDNETPIDVAKRCKRWEVHAILCEAAGQALSSSSR